MRGIVVLAACGIALQAAGAQAADQAELRAVVDKAVGAHGGAAALARLRAGIWQATGQMYNVTPPLDYTATGDRAGPDQARLTVDVTIGGQRMQRTVVVDGDRGWVSINGRVAEMDAETLAEEKERAFATWVATLTPLVDGPWDLQAAPPTNLNNRPAVGVRVAAPGHRPVVLYFDQQSGLLVKKETAIHEPHGKGPDELQETYYGAYEAVDGVKFARHVQVHRRGELSLDCRYTTVRLLPELPRTTFAPPEGASAKDGR